MWQANLISPWLHLSGSCGGMTAHLDAEPTLAGHPPTPASSHCHLPSININTPGVGKQEEARDAYNKGRATLHSISLVMASCFFPSMFSLNSAPLLEVKMSIWIKVMNVDLRLEQTWVQIPAAPLTKAVCPW